MVCEQGIGQQPVPGHSHSPEYQGILSFLMAITNDRPGSIRFHSGRMQESAKVPETV